MVIRCTDYEKFDIDTWPCKISLQSVHPGAYAAPKIINFHFLVKIIAHWGEPLDKAQAF